MNRSLSAFASVVLLLFVLTDPAASQSKIAWINSEAIMSQLSDATDVQRQLDALVNEWQTELKQMQDEFQKSFDDYQRRKLILTETRRAEVERELRELDQKIVQFRTQKFGQNGELFQKQSDLMKPIQDRIFNAIKEVALEDGYDYIFDKSGQILLMYSNEKFDVTSKVLERVKTMTSTPATTR